MLARYRLGSFIVARKILSGGDADFGRRDISILTSFFALASAHSWFPFPANCLDRNCFRVMVFNMLDLPAA